MIDTLSIFPEMLDFCFRSEKFLSVVTNFLISKKCVPNLMICSEFIPISKISNTGKPTD